MDHTNWIIEHLDDFKEDKKVEAQTLIIKYTLLPLTGGYLLGLLGQKYLLMPYITQSSPISKFLARIAFPVSASLLSVYLAKLYREEACGDLRQRIEAEQLSEASSLSEAPQVSE